MRRALLCLLALLLAPLPAAGPAQAQAIEWSPPPPGLVTTYDARFDGGAVEVTQRIVAVEGDVVTVESLPANGDPLESYFRFLLSTASQGATYVFDPAAVAALWPLAPGRTAATRIQATMQGVPIVFDWQATVTAIEEVAVPAGRFRAARVEHSLVAPGYVTLETVTWLAEPHGLPVRTETTATVEGQAPYGFVLELRSLE